MNSLALSIGLTLTFWSGSFCYASKLLVVSGETNDFTDYVTKSEVIDLKDPKNICHSWADHPTGTRDAAGTFINTSLHICGGNNPNSWYSRDCYLIGPSTAESTAKLTTGSERSAAFEFQGNIWYTGGRGGGHRSQFLDRVEILTTNEVSPGPDLYFPIEDHCIVKLTDETFYLIGGYNGPYSHIRRTTWFYNTSLGWTSGPNMRDGRYRHACSSFWLNGEQIIFVSPGKGYPSKRTEFLNLNQENLQWIEGPDLPYDHDTWGQGNHMVSNGDTIFYVNTVDNIFLQLDCQSLQDCQWIFMEQKLEFPRTDAVVTLVPDDLCNCTNQK